MNIMEAFDLRMVEGLNYEGGVLSANARATIHLIHLIHRLGALLVTLYILFISLPLAVAVLRNGVVALLLLSLISPWYFDKKPRPI